MRDILEANKEILNKLNELEKEGIERDEKIVLIFEYLNDSEQIKQQEFDQKNRILIGYKQKCKKKN